MSNVQQEICPFCGKVTRPDGNFCTECGHKIEGIFNSQMANRAKINTEENERDEEVENLKATFIPTEANVLEGDSVETSGIGGIYPKGIHIGTVKQVVNTKNITNRYAIIETAVDFSKLETVLVITN